MIRKTSFNVILLAALIAMTCQHALGQIPTGTPRTDEPVRLNTTADIIIYLVLPLTVIVLGIFWWFFYKKPKNEREKEKADKN
ncbi:hypothetical protein Echvi_2157 [Echinicola vietnamensis DSM 17526]|uniref:Adenylosuccinate synthetase n=2 Tax=Echinicola TaxID=390846 RepID=L0FZD6_ECHVK|nr:hypothetical protein Echvi_2157 [Echinicola vietnamensis DSM 17526]